MISEFERFIKEKRYVSGLSPNTEYSYRLAFRKYQASGFDNNQFIIDMRESGLSPVSCNIFIRSINSFLRWAGKIPLKQLKAPRRAITVFSDNEIQAILSYKPKSYQERRLHCLLTFLLDTGIRINEALSLSRTKLDFNNLLIVIFGKGNKERIIPFSVELRKVLYKFLSGHKFDLVFCNRHGGKLGYNNVRRDFLKLMDKLGIEPDGSFHAFRRYYATHFIRQNGNPFLLQRLMGHSSLSTTQDYVKLVTEDLSKAHARTSVLARFR